MFVRFKNMTVNRISLPGPLPRLSKDDDITVEIAPEEYDRVKDEIGSLVDQNLIRVFVEVGGSFLGNFTLDDETGEIKHKGTVIAPTAAPSVRIVGVSSADTTPGYLEMKVTAGGGIILTKKNIGGDEQLEISSTAGGGNVTGPVGATDNGIARYDGASGTVIKDSNVTVDNSGNISTPGTINGVKTYSPSATDPTIPAPADGDRYYNTAIDMWMFYDATRTKWLSIESQVVQFGRNGNTAAGSYYRAVNGLTFTAAIGYPSFFNGTVVAIGYTRSDIDVATFEITANGVPFSSLASSVVSGTDLAKNNDFNQNDILGVLNQSGGNTTSDVQGWFKIRWRA